MSEIPQVKRTWFVHSPCDSSPDEYDNEQDAIDYARQLKASGFWHVYIVLVSGDGECQEAPT